MFESNTLFDGQTATEFEQTQLQEFESNIFPCPQMVPLLSHSHKHVLGLKPFPIPQSIPLLLHMHLHRLVSKTCSPVQTVRAWFLQSQLQVKLLSVCKLVQLSAVFMQSQLHVSVFRTLSAPQVGGDLQTQLQLTELNTFTFEHTCP